MYFQITFPFRIILLILFFCTPLTACSKKKTAISSVLREKNKATINLISVNAKAILAEVNAHKGKRMVLLNCWATWCAPCVEEFSDIVKIKDKYSQELAVIFLSFDSLNQQEKVIEFLRQQTIEGSSYIKKQNDQDFLKEMPEQWSGALPLTLIYAKNGDMIMMIEGKTNQTRLRMILDLYLNKKRKNSWCPTK